MTWTLYGCVCFDTVYFLVIFCWFNAIDVMLGGHFFSVVFIGFLWCLWQTVCWHCLEDGELFKTVVCFVIACFHDSLSANRCFVKYLLHIYCFIKSLIFCYVSWVHIAGKRHLRSARTGLLSVPRTVTTLGIRSFAVAGPVIWNSLPAALRTATLSPLTFAQHLKAHLFGWSAAHLRTIYDVLYKSTHHHHHHMSSLQET